jgi:hypothetical protein
MMGSTVPAIVAASGTRAGAVVAASSVLIAAPAIAHPTRAAVDKIEAR